MTNDLQEITTAHCCCSVYFKVKYMMQRTIYLNQMYMCTGSYYGITGIQELTESCTLFQQNMHSWHCQHIAHDTCQHVSWQINFELSKEE